MPFYSRKTTRMPNYDYRQVNYYFITVCTEERRCIFGTVDRLNTWGRIVDTHIQRLPGYYHGITVDKYVVMPNHVHMILMVENQNNPGIPQIIGQFKSGVTREIRKTGTDRAVWQRSFHDHIIRDQAGYEKIWNYIDGNPQCWEKDCFYPENSEI